MRRSFPGLVLFLKCGPFFQIYYTFPLSRFFKVCRTFPSVVLCFQAFFKCVALCCTFSSVPHFSKFLALFQVCHVFASVLHYFKCIAFFFKCAALCKCAAICKCGAVFQVCTLFQVWCIFLSLALFSNCAAQVWRIVQSVRLSPSWAHFLKSGVTHFSK